ncbi:MAG: hypothetical protein AB7L09_12315 [Nitrospira sp.]
MQRPGLGWRAVHGLLAAEYQTTFDALMAQGYAPVLVSATGPADRATFTALFEQGVAGPWFARHDLRWDPQAPFKTVLSHGVSRFTARRRIVGLPVSGSRTMHQRHGHGGSPIR